MTRAVDERLVTDIWERQAVNASGLQALGLRVLSRGVPSDAGGPDYQDALLVYRERHTMHGDIEFHVLSSDWYAHGHHRDPRYGSVILHVVWQRDDAETLTCDGRVVPVLVIQDGVTADTQVRWQAGRPALVPHRCIASFGRLQADELRARIFDAGMTRFAQRAERFAADATSQPVDQVAYTALLEGLGYASNRETFRLLADAVPLTWLLGVPPPERAATLLDAAGLGPTAPYPPPAHLDPRAWRLVRLRPANHPVVRLLGVVQLLNRLEPRLSEELARAVTHVKEPKELRTLLQVQDGSSTLIGTGRADELAVSVVLPLVAGLFPVEAEARAVYSLYPSPPSNRWTRFMQHLMRQAGRPFRPVKAPEHQGLHHLYHQFCRVERTKDCPICSESTPVSSIEASSD